MKITSPLLRYLLRIRSVRNAILSCILGILAGTACHATGAASLFWKCSTAAAPWIDKPAIPLTRDIPVPTEKADRILIDSHRTAQIIDGWGGCFNERGWKAMQSLSPLERGDLLHALFDPKTGLKLNFGRTPIGASDYAVTLYSLDEAPGDSAMLHFSVARDEQLLIPYIKAALAIRPDLKLWAVPWSPPSWMKTNGNLVGGSIKDDDATLEALARYFVHYLQAYKLDGIHIGMVMPQNEPNITSNYTSCQWTGVQLAKFVGHHLGPAITSAGLSTTIFLGDFNESSRGGYSYWVAPSIQDPQTRPYVAGVGCQWDADITMAETHFLLPEMKLMQSEAECGNTNSNDWAFAERQYQLAKKWFAAGADSYMIWNLVLDQTGLSTGHWPQCSPVVVDTQTQKVIYTPYFYLYKHFSYFIQPGAHLAATYSTWSDKLAFVNPDGSVVAVVGNSSPIDLPVTLHLNGLQSATITIPPHSFNTFVLPRAE